MTSIEAIVKLNILSSYDTEKEKREEYKECIYAIIKDLKILNILKPLIEIIPTYTTDADSFYDIRIKPLHIIDDEILLIIKEWLENDK